MGRLWGSYGYSVTMSRFSVRAIRASRALRSSWYKRRIAGTRRAASRNGLNRPISRDSAASAAAHGGAAIRDKCEGGLVSTFSPFASRLRNGAITSSAALPAWAFDNILADALSTALSVRIVGYRIGASAIKLAPAGGLSRERQQRVRDYI
jgi:hypothetical protein